MAQPAPAPRMDEAAYLAWVETQPCRHEFVQGRVYAVREPDEPDGPQACELRSRVVATLGGALRAHLRGLPCKVHEGHVRLSLPRTAAHLYPDLVVDGPVPSRLPGSRSAGPQPLMVAEVLSPSTGSVYPGVRFAHYRTLDSLRDYVLLDPCQRRADVCRRDVDGLWTVHTFESGDQLELASLEWRMPVAQVFAGLP